MRVDTRKFVRCPHKVSCVPSTEQATADLQRKAAGGKGQSWSEVGEATRSPFSDASNLVRLIECEAWPIPGLCRIDQVFVRPAPPATKAEAIATTAI
jgi:hypothetical protein